MSKGSNQKNTVPVPQATRSSESTISQASDPLPYTPVFFTQKPEQSTSTSVDAIFPVEMAEYKCLGKRVSFTQSVSLRTGARAIGVFTSGGDAQGMNAALRAIVRVTIANDIKAFAIYEGYQGLVEGGDKIREITWTTVSGIIHKGGTVVGTARCKAFLQRDGRLKAAENLIKRGINNLAVIGGDGSLTGANIFKEEWAGLVKELLEKKRISEKEAEQCKYLNIVGLVGSIDNDMCGTDMTIGTDSALHRIIEAIDCLTSTAASHQRSFVLEVMGRHCGYLALMAGIAGGADWVLIPEKPPAPGWEDAMCKKVTFCRQQGRRHSLVLVSEGAVDTNNKLITSKYVKDVLDKQLGHDTRITVLGHVQRGGKPSAYDRATGCRMGAAAALTLISAWGEVPPQMIGIQGNIIVQVPLMDCVKRTRAIDKAMSECNFKRALELRGDGFHRSIKVLKRLESCGTTECQGGSPTTPTSPSNFRLAVMTIGAPAAGMNSCSRAFVRLLLYQGHKVFGIEEGFIGVLNDDIHEMTWKEVDDWASAGGSNLGTNRTIPTEHTLPEIAAKFGEHKIQGLLVVGGFEAYESLLILEKNRQLYTAFRIPLLGVAATISNNVPGTDFSLGCDTALNMITGAMDTLKQSAHANRKRVFVVETMGGYCGYLATMAAMAGGADAAYIYEEKFTIGDLQRDIRYMVGKFRDGLQRGMLLRNEYCNVNYTTEFISQLLEEEGKGMFVARTLVLGHLQQGENPSPFDRILGVKYASHAVDFMIEHISNNISGTAGKIRATGKESACMLGVHGTAFKAIPLQDLAQNTDFKCRIPKNQWWMRLRPLISVLAKHREHVFLGEEDPHTSSK